MTSYDYKIASWNRLQQFPDENTVHLYVMPVTCHWTFRGHSDFILQLHCFNSSTDNIFVVGIYYARHVPCARIADFHSVLLKTAWRLLNFGNC